MISIVIYIFKKYENKKRSIFEIDKFSKININSIIKMRTLIASSKPHAHLLGSELTFSHP